MASDELPPYHYFRLPGESEPDRLRRLIAHTSKHVGGGDGNGYWQKELNRFKAELAHFEHKDTVQIVGTAKAGRLELRSAGEDIRVELNPPGAHDPNVRLADIEKQLRWWVIVHEVGRFEGNTPLVAAKRFWVVYANDLPGATINHNGRPIDLQLFKHG